MDEFKTRHVRDLPDEQYDLFLSKVDEFQKFLWSENTIEIYMAINAMAAVFAVLDYEGKIHMEKLYDTLRESIRLNKKNYREDEAIQ